MAEPHEEIDTLDIGGLFRGTATITFVAEIVSAIMILGSGAAYILSRGTLSQDLNTDIAVFLVLIGAMITLFIFIGAIGFFVRFNRRIQGAVIGRGIGSVDLAGKGVKTVLTLYGLAVGLILIMGIYGYWLVWRYYLSPIAASSLSFFMLSISLGIFVVAFLIQIVIVALGRTATKVVKAVFVDGS